MSFFEKNNLRLHYEIVDGVCAEDTLFLHGNLAGNIWWQPLMELWSKQPKQKGRAILVEWRGCGKTNCPPNSFQMETIAGDCNDLLDHLKMKQVHIVGHSTGGIFALYAMNARPDLYRKAALLDSVSATGIQFGPEMYDAFTAMSKSREMCEAVIMGTIHETNLSADLRKQIIDTTFGVDPQIWHGIPKMLDKVDFRAQLKNIKQPVLVMHGEFDTLLPMQGSEELAEGLPNGKFFKIPGRGHSTNVENPALLSEILAPFLFG